MTIKDRTIFFSVGNIAMLICLGVGIYIDGTITKEMYLISWIAVPFIFLINYLGDR